MPGRNSVQKWDLLRTQQNIHTTGEFPRDNNKLDKFVKLWVLQGSVGRHTDLTCFHENTDRIAGSFISCLHVGQPTAPFQTSGDHPIPHPLFYCFFPVLWDTAAWFRVGKEQLLHHSLQRQSLISVIPFSHKNNAGWNSQNSAMQKHKVNKWF